MHLARGLKTIVLEDLVRVQFDFWSALLAFGVFQGLFLVGILLSYRDNRSAKYLAILLGVLVLNLANYLLLSTQLFREFPHLAHLATPLLFLQGPVYMAYIFSLTGKKWKGAFYWHGLPFLLGIVLMLPFYGLSAELKITVLEVGEESGMLLTLDATFYMAAQMVHALIYVLIAHLSIRQTANTVASKSVQMKLRWLRRFGGFFLVYWGIDLLVLVWCALQGAMLTEVLYGAMLCNALLVNVLIFFAIKHNKKFNQALLNHSSAPYKNSSLNGQQAAVLLERIIKVMEAERPYLDQELTLARLSACTDLPAHTISQVLNAALGKSFYAFINEYRYKEVRKRLVARENQHLTILAIAFESGFNNKNTFNKVFKQHAGLTPSQFLKQQKAIST